MTLRPEDSVLKVRRSIHIKAKPAAVWEKFTTMKLMDSWWGHKTGNPEAGESKGQWLDVYEPRAGGRIEMSVLWDGASVAYGGAIKTFSGTELTFESDWMPNRGWKAPTYMTVRLVPALDGTLVELFHYGFERTGGDVAAEHEGYEQGWGMTQLSALKRICES
jgi:uncharacterized protein YndB with AHSA1/START domain